jgi:hypothetical protein
MPLIQEGEWVERGTIIDGPPRKATVDASAGAAVRIAEMSSTAGYFEDESLQKIEKDLSVLRRRVAAR